MFVMVPLLVSRCFVGKITFLIMLESTSQLEKCLAKLPSELRERIRCLQPRTCQEDGEFVLYWMRTAIRSVENPALDAAIALANQLELPVLVYHGLSERYPYASDRHHTFVMEAARDVQRSFSELGIGYAFHLERPSHRGKHLKELSMRSAVVVTEDMPVDPLRRWNAVLARSVKTPVLAVDTACVVPMQMVGKAYDRAFAFRESTKRLYAERLGRFSKPVTPAVCSDIPSRLPFESIDFSQADIAELVATCEIDHSVGPVTHTPGGSNAGYARWNDFKKNKISKYARLRNNPLVDGVSRMSAYLHYGMVSPMGIAREAAELKHSGSEKFLDELLIWRELAYAFCFYRTNHARFSALPAWAIATLNDHADDPRPDRLCWEQLARGRSGDQLWDAAQRSLLIHGELHNNVRMTWGKALLNWTPNAKQALSMMVDLNHRYALDGRDPASFGGILWCLGQFDRPFSPERAVFGTVRDRSTEQHVKRLDPKAWMRKTTRSLFEPTPRVAVIGAGLSGLICARTLSDHGCQVTVFEKSRGAGGRMSTRRAEPKLRFDHGAQYFTVRDPRFRRYVESWTELGVVAPWLGRIVVLKNGEVIEEKRGLTRHVGVPGMNAICKHLVSDLDVRFETQVAPLERLDNEWRLTDENMIDLGRFDVAVVSAPAAQTALLCQTAPKVAQVAEKVAINGCWALMIAVPDSLGLEFDAAFVHNSSISWMARNNSKPKRDDQAETWVVHAASAWSQQNLEIEQQAAACQLLDEFWKATGLTPQETTNLTAHRWRYALPESPLTAKYLSDESLRLFACGDWCGGPRVEGAFLSGMAASGRVLGLVNHINAPKQAYTARQKSLF